MWALDLQVNLDDIVKNKQQGKLCTMASFLALHQFSAKKKVHSLIPCCVFQSKRQNFKWIT